MPDFNLEGRLILKGADISGAQKDLKKLQIPKLSTGNINALTAAVNSLSMDFSTLAATVGKAEKALGGLKKENSSLASSQAKTSAAIAKTANNAQDFADKAGLALRRFTAFTIATGGVFGAIRGISSGIKEAISFEREMLRVTQVTKALPTQIDGLRKSIRGLSSEFGTEAKELVESAKVLSQAEFSLADTQVALRAVAQSSLAPTFSDTKETTEALVAVYKQFNIEAKDLSKTLSIIDTVSAKFAVEADDIVKAVQRAGGVFQASSEGIVSGNEALAQFAALITSVRATTRESAETIATGLRTIISRLQRPVTIQFLEDLGIQLRDANGQFVGAFEAIQRIGNALRALPATDTKFSQIVEQIGGFRQVSKVVPLIQQTDLQVRALNEALSNQDSISQSAAEAQGNLAVELSKTREQFEALVRDVVDSDAFQLMAAGANTLARALIAVTNALSDVLPLMAAVAGIKFAATFAKSGGIKAFAQRVFTNQSRSDTIPTLAGGGTNGKIKGRGTPKSDGILTRVSDGEFIIPTDKAIQVGYDNLEHIRKYGNLPVAARGTKGSVLADSQFRQGSLEFADEISKLGVSTNQAAKYINEAASSFENAEQALASLKKTAADLKQASKDAAQASSANAIAAKKEKENQKQLSANRELDIAKTKGGTSSSNKIDLPVTRTSVENDAIAQAKINSRKKNKVPVELRGGLGSGGSLINQDIANQVLTKEVNPDAVLAEMEEIEKKVRAKRNRKGQKTRRSNIEQGRAEGDRLEGLYNVSTYKGSRDYISYAERNGPIKNDANYLKMKSGFEGDNPNYVRPRSRVTSRRQGSSAYGQVSAESLGLGSAGAPLTTAQLNRIGAENKYADSVMNSSIKPLVKSPDNMAIGVEERKIAARQMTKAEYKAYSSQQRGLASGNLNAVVPGFSDTMPVTGNVYENTTSSSGSLTSRQARAAYVSEQKRKAPPFRGIRRSLRRNGIGLNAKTGNIIGGLAAAAGTQAEDPYLRNISSGALGAGSLASLAGAGPVGVLAAGAVGATYGAAKGAIESKQLEAQNRLDDSTKALGEAFSKLSENAQKTGRILVEDIAAVIQKNSGRDENLQNKLIEDQTTVGNAAIGLFSSGAQDSLRFRAAAGESTATSIAENLSGTLGGDGFKKQALREDRGRNLINQQRADGNKETAQAARDFIAQEIRAGRGRKNIGSDTLLASVSDNADAIRSGSKSYQNFEAEKQFAEISKTIAAQQKLSETSQKADLTLQAMNESAARAADIIGIFGQELQANSNALGGISSRALGSAGEVGGTRINPFENIKALSPQDLNGAITSLENTLGGSFGNDAKSLVNANSALQQLGPEIRAGLLESGELNKGSSQGLQQALASQFSGDPRLQFSKPGKLAGLPDNIKDQIRSGIDNLTPEDAQRFADTGDLSDILGKLSPKVENVTAAMAKLQEASNQLQDSLLAGANQRTAIFDKGNSLFAGLRDTETTNLQTREDLLGFGTSSANAVSDGKRAIGSLTGGTADPSAILDNIRGLEQDRSAILAGGPLNADSAMEISELNSSINSNKAALEKLSGSVIGLAQIQQELARIESRRQGAQDALIGGAFASPEQQEQNARGALALNAFDKGGFGAVQGLGLSKSDIQAGFNSRLSFLQSTGTEKEVDAFKTDFSRKIGFDLTKGGGDLGTIDTLRQKGAFELKGDSKEAKVQESLLVKEQTRQEDAIKAQISLLQTATVEFDAKFQESFTKGLARLQEAATQLSIPENITMSVQHSDINVNLNNGDFLTSLDPYIKDKATQIVNAAIQNMTGGATSPLKVAYNVAKATQAARQGKA